MLNGWCDQVFIQGLYFIFYFILEYIHISERINISESIYERVVKPSYRKIYEDRIQPYFLQQEDEGKSRLRQNTNQIWDALESARKGI